MAATQYLRTALPRIFEEYEITSILDIPCGDAHWISACIPSHMRYAGGDIVDDIVTRNRERHGGLGSFERIDIVNSSLPKADLLLVRDCFIHLPNSMILTAINNIRRSQIKYLATTTFPTEQCVIDIEIGGYRPVNLTLPPFRLPPPEGLFIDEDGVTTNGKHIGLWRVSSL